MALDSFRNDFKFVDMTDYELDDAQANIASVFQLGAMAGAFVTFPIAEKIGRRWAVIFACLVFCLGASLMTGSHGLLSMMIAGRVLAGFGIGSATLVVPVYIAEIAPPSIRGRLVGIFEVTSNCGAMLGFWISYATDRTISSDRPAQWIIPMGLQLVPSALLAAGIFFCPESPRWLARKDKFDEVEKILVYLRHLPADHEFIRNEMEEIRKQVEQRSTNRLSKKQQVQKMFAPGTRNRIGVGAFLMFLQSFTGVNVMTYYSPRIFETLGVTGTSTKLFSTGLYGVAKTLGMITFTLFVVEGLGRRKGLIYGAALGSLPLWYVGAYVVKADPASRAVEGAVQQDGWGYLAMVCIYLNAFIICATWQGITWTYAAEIFPLDIRMLCVSFTTASTWLGSFFIARVTPFMITGLGYGTFFVFGGIVILMGTWAFFFVPETKGMLVNIPVEGHSEMNLLTTRSQAFPLNRWTPCSCSQHTRLFGISSGDARLLWMNPESRMITQ